MNTHPARLRLSALALLAATLALAGCNIEEIRPQPNARVHDGEIKHDMVVTGEEPDYAVRYTFSVTNDGASGNVSVLTRLTSSEGEWQRTQNLHFAAGESKRLSYLFAEPSIFATNIEGRVAATP